MKNFFKISPFIMLLISCSRFPYSGVISESKRWINETHPEYKTSIEFKEEKIHFLRYANPQKPILLLIHGSPGDWGSFAHFFKDESLKEDFEIITFSRLGFGNNRPGVPYGDLVDQILPAKLILEKFKNNRNVIVVGHSYGGPVAMKLAFEHKELVDGVLLAAASMDPELEEMKWYQHVAKVWPIRSLIPDILDVTNREILLLKDELIKMEKDYQSFNKPLYVLQGEIDVLVPKENVDYVIKHTELDESYVKRIKNARHFLPWAFPDSIKFGVRKLLNDLND